MTRNWLLAGLHSSDHNCLNLMQADLMPPWSSFIQSIYLQFGCKDTMRDIVRSVAEAKVHGIRGSRSLGICIIKKAVKLARHNLPFVNLCWMLLVTFLTFVCLEMASRWICCITFPVVSWILLLVDIFCLFLFKPSEISPDLCGSSKR